MQRQPPAAANRKKGDMAMMRERLPENETQNNDVREIARPLAEHQRSNANGQQQPERGKLRVKKFRRMPFHDLGPRNLQVIEEPQMKLRAVRIHKCRRDCRGSHQTESKHKPVGRSAFPANGFQSAKTKVRDINAQSG